MGNSDEDLLEEKHVCPNKFGFIESRKEKKEEEVECVYDEVNAWRRRLGQ
jgi:hypothetical protein